MAYGDNDTAERERRRWTRENAYLYTRPDAERFVRPDAERFLKPGEKLDRYWERPEFQSPAMRAYAKPPAPVPAQSHAGEAEFDEGSAFSTAGDGGEAARVDGRAPGYIPDQHFANAATPVPKFGPSHSKLLKLKSDLAALRMHLADRPRGSMVARRDTPPISFMRARRRRFQCPGRRTVNC